MIVFLHYDVVGIGPPMAHGNPFIAKINHHWRTLYKFLTNAFGRMVAMRTFRDENGPGDATRWYYHEPTGLLTNKLYADGKGTTYTYTPEGKLATRTWARGITTTYSYDAAQNLTSISYWRNSVSATPDPDTPEVSFTHDRLGRITSAIVDGVSTNLYSYDALTLALSAEIQNGSTISRTTDALGRNIGFELDNDYSVTYGYDTYGRFASVASSIASIQSTQSMYTYSYLPNTDLLSGYTVGDFTRTVAYEPYRSLVTSVANKHSSTTISQYDYENDALGRRTAIARSGTAFGDMPVRDAYGYNHRSEVTSARRTLANNPSQEVRGFSYDYAYDPIGNRTSSTEYDHENNALVSSYTANALNQYEQRTVPGYAAVRGSATNSATVTVNSNPVWRLDDYFYGGDEADNSTTAIMKELAIIAAHSNNYSAVTGSVFVAQTPEAFTYDEDGNLLSDGRWQYTWNGENRLIKAVELFAPTTRQLYEVNYAYDHRGRMVWKQITALETPPKTISYTWDDYNIIAEVESRESEVTTTYNIWGLDLSGILQGAGGVGGLLAVIQGRDGSPRRPFLPCYDANGNITEYVDSDGTIAAHYEYSPFGEIVVQSGDLADSFTHRFSTKPWCPVTGFSEYELRKYSPSMGRWLSRDPIGERGGLNVYVFVLNRAVEYVDSLGQLSSSLPDYSKKDFSIKASGSAGLGGHISILIIRESAKHCCTSGQFAGEMKDIIEWTFGPEIGVHIGLNATVQFAGVGVDIGFTGPGISLRLSNVTRTFDRCFPDDAFAHLELINLELAPGIQNVAVGLGNLAKVEGSMKAWFDFQANVDVTPDGFDLNGGIFVDYDVSIKGYLGFQEFILLNIDTLAPDGKHQRIPLVEF